MLPRCERQRCTDKPDADTKGASYVVNIGFGNAA